MKFTPLFEKQRFVCDVLHDYVSKREYGLRLVPNLLHKSEILQFSEYFVEINVALNEARKQRKRKLRSDNGRTAQDVSPNRIETVEACQHHILHRFWNADSGQ